MMPLNFSVIIPALNEATRIARAVQSAWKAGAGEVILADGGSQDDTCDRARKLDCRIVNGSPGRGRQQNAGAAVAKHDVLLFLHADCWLADSCGRQITEGFERRADSVVGAFRQQIDNPGSCYRWLEWGNDLRVRRLGVAYGDQGIFVRRETFWTVGGFADVPLMEDVVLMRQLRRFGSPLLLAGPVSVSARRWQRQGPLKQTLRNWCLLAAFQCGVSPHTLQRFYVRHDQQAE